MPVRGKQALLPAPVWVRKTFAAAEFKLAMLAASMQASKTSRPITAITGIGMCIGQAAYYLVMILVEGGQEL